MILTQPSNKHGDNNDDDTIPRIKHEEMSLPLEEEYEADDIYCVIQKHPPMPNIQQKIPGEVEKYQIVSNKRSKELDFHFLRTLMILLNIMGITPNYAETKINQPSAKQKSYISH